MSRARVIKGGQPRQPSPRPRLIDVLKAKEAEIETRRRSRLEAIETEVAEHLKDAQVEGLRLKEATLDEARAEAVGLLVDAKQRAEAITDRARADLTRLAVGIAEKILGAELALAPERVAEIVGQVLRAAGPSERLVAHVHPLDLPLLEIRWERLSRLAEEGTLELQADTTVERGGCVLETDRGIADGRLKVQLAMIQAALFDDSPADPSPQTRPSEGSLEEGPTTKALEDGLSAVVTTVAAPLDLARETAPMPAEDRPEKEETEP